MKDGSRPYKSFSYGLYGEKANPTTPIRKPQFTKEQHRKLERAKERKRDEIDTGEVWDEC